MMWVSRLDGEQVVRELTIFQRSLICCPGYAIHRWHRLGGHVTVGRGQWSMRAVDPLPML